MSNLLTIGYIVGAIGFIGFAAMLTYATILRVMGGEPTITTSHLFLGGEIGLAIGSSGVIIMVAGRITGR